MTPHIRAVALLKIGWDQLYGSVAPRAARRSPSWTRGRRDATDLDDVLVPGTSVLAGSHWSEDPKATARGRRGSSRQRLTTYGIAGVAYGGVGVMPVVVLGTDGTGRTPTSSRVSSTRPIMRRTSSSWPSVTRAIRPALQAAIDYDGRRAPSCLPQPATTAPVLRRNRRGTGGWSAWLRQTRPMSSTGCELRASRLDGRTGRRHPGQSARRCPANDLRHLGGGGPRRRRCRASRSPRSPSSNGAIWGALPETPIRSRPVRPATGA